MVLPDVLALGVGWGVGSSNPSKAADTPAPISLTAGNDAFRRIHAAYKLPRGRIVHGPNMRGPMRLVAAAQFHQ